MSKHDLFAFMRSVQSDMAFEYKRILSRVFEDPGTAGDQVEENWKELLGKWLPSNYPIVTKGRIINHEGEVSPQVDVLVLNPAYPLYLREKKLYFAGGVVAAFECKLTLKASSLPKVFRNSKIIKNLTPKQTGTPFDELQKPIIYGLLAHSHAWRGNTEEAIYKMMDSIENCRSKCFDHPSEMVDIISIANTVTFTLGKQIHIKPLALTHDEFYQEGEPVEKVSTCYFGQWGMDKDNHEARGAVLGSLICELTRLMAYADTSIRGFAEYLMQTQIMGNGRGIEVTWPTSVLSAEVVKKIVTNGYSEERWSKWSKDLT